MENEEILYYAVYEEHTIGFLFIAHGGRRYFGILHASVLKGSNYNWLSGPILVDMAKVRAATPQDFEEYRVTLPCDYETIQSK